MADSIDPRTPPGIDAAMNSYATTAKSLQSFASEMQRLSKTTMDQTTQLMEKLRGVRSMEDFASIQSSFLQQSFANYADYARKFSELMVAMPMELAKQGQSAFQQGADAMTNAAGQADEQIHKTVDQHHG